jgi:hypothetical protein
MKDDLAEDVLARIMEWSPQQLVEYGPQLQVLASLKYDDYEGFRPGEKFLESLARWLHQFATIEERRIAMTFVLNELVFISRAELEHAIELVYPDFIRPRLREFVATDLAIAPHLVSQITSSVEFQARQRRMMILGLADGARLDRLRRACPLLSHEQFSVIPDMSDELIRAMVDRLSTALAKRELPGLALFQHVLLVDDFTGSGYTLIRQKDDQWAGKLIHAKDRIDHMQSIGALADPAHISVLLYIGNGAAMQYVREHMNRAGLSNWSLEAVQRIPDECKVTDPDIRALGERYYDPILDDEYKGRAVFGFREMALPLVLSHNTPNDSIALLWGDTSQRDDSRHIHALFPRYERHHVDRP